MYTAGDTVEAIKYWSHHYEKVPGWAEVAQAFNPSTSEAKAGCEFKASPRASFRKGK